MYKWPKVHEKVLNITNHQRNVSQNFNGISPPNLLEWLSSKIQELTSAGEDVEKRDPSCTTVGI